MKNSRSKEVVTNSLTHKRTDGNTFKTNVTKTHGRVHLKFMARRRVWGAGSDDEPGLSLMMIH